ncbi:MAG: hypothetical protein EZS28_013651 [Streblomastix strix]|uniref:Uncharacterized protein n=1 Tax=Streblomastix strix TaxID=222440 RepID=A0A5J4W903_9EUKA|nr:MAG: hypothetical protein EZS28_013651 [Streblomastix strix]
MSKKYKDTEEVVRNIEAAKAKVHPIPTIKYKIASHSMKQRNETQKNKIEFFTDHSKLIAEQFAIFNLIFLKHLNNYGKIPKKQFNNPFLKRFGIMMEYQKNINN